MAGKMALLMGLFVAPAVLLWLGQGLRNRGALARGAFWGGVIGHTLALAVMLVAAHWPPVAWGDASPRSWLVNGSLVTGAAVGAAIGVLRAHLRAVE